MTVPGTRDLKETVGIGSGNVTPLDKLAGRAPKILADRDRKLEQARERRRIARHQARLADAERLVELDKGLCGPPRCAHPRPLLADVAPD